MAKLRVTMVDGSAGDYAITPVVEYSFEQYWKKGFHKAFREDEQQTYLYWLAYEAKRRAGDTVKPWGDAFVETLADVTVLDDDASGE